jgi:hypothetical protein
MADQRIKGQEVEVILVVNNVPQATITDVKNFEATLKFEKKQEGYLGETSDRYDEVFMGIDGGAEFHFENQDLFTLFQSISDRARRRQPGTQVNVKATLSFPNGQRKRAIFPNVFFGNIPITFGGRTEYGNFKLDFSGSDYQTL